MRVCTHVCAYVHPRARVCARVCMLYLCARARVRGHVACSEPRARAQTLLLQAGSLQHARSPLGAQPCSSPPPGAADGGTGVGKESEEPQGCICSWLTGAG